MNNDKIEVSRDALLAAANRLSDRGQAAVAEPLWEALAAPTAKRQPVAEETTVSVLRDAVEQALIAMKRIYQSGYETIINMGGSCDEPGYMIASDPTAIELRALLAKPAAQHQYEPVAWLDANLGSVISAKLKTYNLSKGGAVSKAVEAYQTPLCLHPAEQPTPVALKA